MPTTNHYGLTYLAPGEPLYQARAQLEDNAWTTEAALKRIQAQVNQWATLMPGGQTVIGLDTDGRPYFDPAGSVANPVGMGLDTDGRPYFVQFENPEGT
jgi:hypothetical protein